MKRFICLLLVCTFSISSIAQAADIRTVALSGQQAPGMPDGVNFAFGLLSDIEPRAQINDAGQTAFLGAFTGGPGTGIWSEGSGSLALVARRGDHAPGTPDGVSFRSFLPRSLMLNGAGQTAFSASLDGSGVDGANDWGSWLEGSGSLALVVRSGDQAPGTPSGVNFDFGGELAVLNDAGQTAFRASLVFGTGVDFTNFSGIWSEGSGTLSLVARQGDPVPGLPSGVNYGVVREPVVFNNAGQTAFRASLTGGGEGIWSEGSGTMALVAREGSQAPGAPEGVNFGSFSRSRPVLNNAGQIAFYTPLARSSADPTNEGVWSDRSGSLALVARSGDHAPGLPSGTVFTGFNNRVALNDAGQIAFIAGFTGGGGIWSDASGTFSLVARSGEHAPGTPDGVNFNSFFGLPALNDAGQIAFYAASLAAIGFGPDGIWATDRSGDLQLIAREGDLLEVAPGDFRTVSFLDPNHGETGVNSNGRPSFFNNLGQVVFAARFTDGTAGVFVSNRVAVPEPSTLAFAAAGLFGVAIARRRRAT